MSVLLKETRFFKTLINFSGNSQEQTESSDVANEKMVTYISLHQQSKNPLHPASSTLIFTNTLQNPSNVEKDALMKTLNKKFQKIEVYCYRLFRV